MRVRWISSFVAGVLLAPLAAQEAKKADEKPAAEKTAASVADLEKQYQEAFQAFLTKYRAAKTPEERRTLQSGEYNQLRKEFADKFLKFAQGHRKSADALQALTWIFRNAADGAIRTQAQEQVISDHVNDKAIVPIVASLGRGENQTLLEKLVSQSTSREVRGAALFIQAQAAKGRELTEQNAKDVMPLYERIRKEFGDVELVYATGFNAGKLSELVDNEIFAFEHLRIGKVAPDIEGEDADGVKFKLSDYRGKVVLIDFWGDW